MTVVQREHPFPVRVVDVSLTGLCFRYDPHRFSIGPGDVLRVRVSKGRQAAIVVVEVRHATTPCEVSDSAFAGVRYKDLSPADHSLFQGLVKIEG